MKTAVQQGEGQERENIFVLPPSTHQEFKESIVPLSKTGTPRNDYWLEGALQIQNLHNASKP